MTIYLNLFETEFLGNVGIAVSQAGLLRVRMFVKGEADFLKLNQGFQEGYCTFDPQQTRQFQEEIVEYLRKEREVFSFPIDWGSYTPFQ